MWCKFYIPFLYFIETRTKTRAKTISWCLIYLFPVLLLFFLFESTKESVELWGQLGLTIVLTYNLYELGYIYNDAETIKKEIKPTLRLSEKEIRYYEGNKKTIYIFRLFVSVVVTFCVYKLGGEFLWYPWLLIPMYAIYNSIRNRLNLLLHFILVTIRYSSPLVVCTGDLRCLIIFTICFSIINVIERCGEKRFELYYFQRELFKNHSLLRCRYYLFIFFISLCVYLNSISELSLFIMIMSLYYFVYRLMIFFMEKIK